MTQHNHTQPGQSLSPDEALRHQQWETFDKWMESISRFVNEPKFKEI